MMLTFKAYNLWSVSTLSVLTGLGRWPTGYNTCNAGVRHQSLDTPELASMPGGGLPVIPVLRQQKIEDPLDTMATCVSCLSKL